MRLVKDDNGVYVVESDVGNSLVELRPTTAEGHAKYEAVMKALACGMLYEEVEHGDERHDFRRMIETPMGVILDMLHDTGVIQAGQQMLFPIGFSCGMDGRLILQIDDAGACRLQRRERGLGDPASVPGGGGIVDLAGRRRDAQVGAGVEAEEDEGEGEPG